MSDNGEVEVENPSGYYPALPKDVQTDSVKLFGKWSYVSFPGLCWQGLRRGRRANEQQDDVEIRDISLTYVKPRLQFQFSTARKKKKTPANLLIDMEEGTFG
jgi:hypothetical protein